MIRYVHFPVSPPARPASACAIEKIANDPGIGQFSLILAFATALLLGSYPLIGAHLGRLGMMSAARPLAYSQFLLLLLSFLCLTWAFIDNDFTVQYVATNSNSLLPLQYRISAVWGPTRGPAALGADPGGWTAAVALFSRRLPLDAVARVLGCSASSRSAYRLRAVHLGSLHPHPAVLPGGRARSQPLLRIPASSSTPMLYMGYVGFSVAFAFAIASLMTGRLDATWARWSRPWTMAAWVFLTLGMVLGSWWAYYELGWGGWWFWGSGGKRLLHALAGGYGPAPFPGGERARHLQGLDSAAGAVGVS